LHRVAKIAGRGPIFVKGDVRDSDLLNRLFVDYSVEAVLHFAGLKSVRESISNPLFYFENNVHGSQVLLQAMADAGVFNFIFSSSATVYGEPIEMPISEVCPIGVPTNPYGRSKLIVEDMLRDLVVSDPRWHIAILRYFNPVGAHDSGLIGEDPSGIPNNLLPYISQVAVGKLPELIVFGNDYPTPDGTGVRDYIHVMDLAEGHLCALEALKTVAGARVWNLGTGIGYSVFEILQAFESASSIKIPYSVASRRLGDVASCYADPSKAKRELGWQANRDLSAMMCDLWRWQQMNPSGFK
jgi:UDP-glucose 4-epimerase